MRSSKDGPQDIKNRKEPKGNARKKRDSKEIFADNWNNEQSLLNEQNEEHQQTLFNESSDERKHSDELSEQEQRLLNDIEEFEDEHKSDCYEKCKEQWKITKLCKTIGYAVLGCGVVLFIGYKAYQKLDRSLKSGGTNVPIPTTSICSDKDGNYDKQKCECWTVSYDNVNGYGAACKIILTDTDGDSQFYSCSFKNFHVDEDKAEEYVDCFRSTWAKNEFNRAPGRANEIVDEVKKMFETEPYAIEMFVRREAFSALGYADDKYDMYLTGRKVAENYITNTDNRRNIYANRAAILDYEKYFAEVHKSGSGFKELKLGFVHALREFRHDCDKLEFDQKFKKMPGFGWGYPQIRLADIFQSHEIVKSKVIYCGQEHDVYYLAECNIDVDGLTEKYCRGVGEHNKHRKWSMSRCLKDKEELKNEKEKKYYQRFCYGQSPRQGRVEPVDISKEKIKEVQKVEKCYVNDSDEFLDCTNCIIDHDEYEWRNKLLCEMETKKGFVRCSLLMRYWATDCKYVEEVSQSGTGQDSPVVEGKEPTVVEETEPQVVEEKSRQLSKKKSRKLSKKKSRKLSKKKSRKLSKKKKPQVVEEKKPQVVEETEPQVVEERKPQSGRVQKFITPRTPPAVPNRRDQTSGTKQPRMKRCVIM